MRQQLGPLHESALEACGRAAPLVARIWGRDADLWPGGADARTRLGWLDAADDTASRAGELRAFAQGVHADGITDVLVLGMGGAVRHAETLAGLVAEPAVRLHVLDSIHPDAVARARAVRDHDDWLVLVASKSGTTLETRTLFDVLHADAVAALGEEQAGRRLAVVTDPDSPLVAVARARHARAIVTANPRLSGRYSALAILGMVPAALLGVDVAAHLAEVAPAVASSRSDELADNTAARLGAVLATASDGGRHHLMVVTEPRLAGFARWLAHVVGESLGKDGRGLVPILDHHLQEPAAYGPDAMLVAFGEPTGLQAIADSGLPTISLPSPTIDTLAAEVFRWEFATAMAGALLHVNPFDAPGAAATAVATRRGLEAGATTPFRISADDVIDAIDDGSRLVLHAWVDPDGPGAARIDEAAAVLRRRLGVPVLVEACPGDLHMTGQLHTQGPPGGVHATLLETPTATIPVPGRDWDLWHLVAAEAAADVAVLREHGRIAGMVDLGDLLDA